MGLPCTTLDSSSLGHWDQFIPWCSCAQKPQKDCLLPCRIYNLLQCLEESSHSLKLPFYPAAGDTCISSDIWSQTDALGFTKIFRWYSRSVKCRQSQQSLLINTSKWFPSPVPLEDLWIAYVSYFRETSRAIYERNYTRYFVISSNDTGDRKWATVL